jgi:hypothetical protein
MKLRSVISIFLGVIFLMVTSTSLQAQQKNLPLSFQLNQELNYYLMKEENAAVHTSLKPYNEHFFSTQAFNEVFVDSGKYYYAFTELLFQKHLMDIKEKDVKLMVDPLFDLSLGLTNQQYMDGRDRLLINTRGFRVMGDITDKFSFETRFYENQFFYPLYLDSIADARGVGFGYGRSKPFKTDGHDVGNSQGNISYSPHKNMNFQLGHGKFFIGNGYRSMLLSDNAQSYPYYSGTFQLFKGKVQYHTINAWLQSLSRIPRTTTAEALFKRKAGSFHYVTFRPGKKLELGLFEATIYKQYEEGEGVINLPYSFYIPLIGLSTTLHGLQSANNVLLGVNGSYRAAKFIEVYGQLAMDDTAKLGWQLGARWFDVAGIKGTRVLVEYNHAARYMYSHTSDERLQNYTHTNQELAHPIGASFDEWVVQLYYQPIERVHLTVHSTTSNRYRTSGTTHGENILLPNDVIPAGTDWSKVRANFLRLEASYHFNVKTRMEMYTSINWRNMYFKGGVPAQQERFILFGFRMNLANFYQDI